jgi:tetratricopeptide (TPR) repeat protein
MQRTGTGNCFRQVCLVVWAAALCACVPAARAQEPEKPPTLDKSKQQLPVTPAQPQPPPVDPAEEATYKAFLDAPIAATEKKAQLGEEFLQKYPQSRYRANVLSLLTSFYFRMGQVEKMTATGEKALATTPNDVQVLAILAQTLPRVLSKDPAVAAKQLEQSEVYARRAIDVTPLLPKPENATDESFAAAKNGALAMAHSGLGLVFLHRQKFNEAVPELEQSVRLEPQPDPVNYYLLGFADEKALHYDDAAAAFAKCAAIQSQLQAKCKAGAEEAKRLALTQPSAPK